MNALDYGFIPNDSNFDNTSKLNEFVTLETDAKLYFPKGTYYFNSLPTEIDRHLTILGDGLNKTGLVKNFSDGKLFHATKTVIIEKMHIHTINGKNGGSAVYLEGLGASESVLRDLYITSPDGTTYGSPIVLYGGSEPLGIRDIFMENIECFAATSHILWGVNVKGLNMIGCQFYPAGGNTNHITLQHYGNLKTENVMFITRYCEQAYLYNVQNIKVIPVSNIIIQNNNSINVKVV